MADTTYVVAIEFDVGDLDSKVHSKLSGLTDLGNKLGGLDAFSSMGNAIEKVGDAFTGVVEQAGKFGMQLGALAGAGAIGAITYGVTSLNSEIEKTQIGLADILTANGVASNLNEGLGVAKDLMGQIRKDAAALPGETSDLATIFKLAAIPGLRTGATPERVEKLSAAAMAYGMGTVGLDSGTTARELSMLLSGKAGAHNVLGMQLAGLSGDEAQHFNKMGSGDRFTYLEQQFGKHAGSIDLYAKSFEGLSSTLKDDTKLLLSTATSPLFESVKEALGKIDGWFDANRDSLTAYATHLGERIADAFAWGQKEIGLWWPAIEAFVENAYGKFAGLWERVGPVVSTVADKLRSALGDPATLDHLESVLKLYAGVKGAQMLAPFARDTIGMGSSILSAGGGVGGLEKLGMSAAPVAEGFEGIGAAAPPLGLAFGTLAAATYGASRALDDSGYIFHDAANRFWQDTKDNLAGAAKAGTDLFPKKSDDAFSPLKLALENGGTVLLGALDVWSTSMKFGAEHAEQFAQILGPISLLLHDWGNHPGVRQLTSFTRDPDPEVALGFGFKRSAAPDKPLVNASAGVGGGNTTYHQTFNFNVATTSEPSRVARTIQNVIAEKSRYPTASRYVRNVSAARSGRGG